MFSHDAPTNKESKKYLVPAVLKAFDIIEFISNKGHASLSDVCKGLSLPKTTAYQIITTLCERGYLIDAPEKGMFTLSFRFLGLGNRVQAGLDLRQEAQPILERLMNDVKQTCHLGVLEDHHAVYLAKAFYQGSPVVNSWVGKRLNLQTTAMGRVLLAWRDENDIRELLRYNPPVQKTPKTILDPEVYIKALGLVRRRGWAEENGENVTGLRCVAAPVRNISGNVIAAIGISGLSAEITDSRLPELSARLIESADELSTRLGFAGDAMEV